jgi:hypothetical protein
MKKYFLFLIVTILVWVSCAYVKMVRHLKISIDKNVLVNKTGTLNEVFVVSPTHLLIHWMQTLSRRALLLLCSNRNSLFSIWINQNNTSIE